MIVTLARLNALAPQARADLAGPLAASLDSWLPDAGIDTPLRRAHFLAQVCVESGGLRRLTESLWYTSAERIAAVWPRLAGRAASLVRNPQALANAAYANRNGNGAESTGDGWTFRGRGLIQLTGRANYRAAGAGLDYALESDPDAAVAPDMAVRIALWFWNSRGCNALADADDADAVTRRVNGPAMQAAAERRALTERAKTIFTETEGI